MPTCLICGHIPCKHFALKPEKTISAKQPESDITAGQYEKSHQHQYTIPVEWQDLPDKWKWMRPPDATCDGVKSLVSPARTVVTKLACVCGAEKEREV